MVALSAVATLLIVGQMLVQAQLSGQRHGAQLIILAVSHRMSSQNLTGAVLSLQRVAHPVVKRRRIEELSVAMAEWESTQDALARGDAARDLPPATDPDLLRLFAAMEPDIREMRDALKALLREAEANRLASLASSALIERIVRADQRFQPQMVRVIALYERDNAARLDRMWKLEIGLLLLTLAVLVFEMVFVFQPAIRKVDDTIGDLRESLRDLEQAKQHAESATRAKSRFLAQMSHEIRTPLNGVVGIADALDGNESDGDRRQLVGNLRKCARVLMRLVNDVLDMASVEAGRIEMRRTTCAVREIAEQTVEVFMPGLDPSGPSLHVNIAPAVPPLVVTDGDRVQQILLNLVGNAVKFTPSGRITLDVDVAQRHLRFLVRDEGPGIEPELLSKLFTRFEQGTNSMTRKHRGTGLGLAISKELATRLGGDLSVRTSLGLGSTFILQIPLETPGHGAVAADTPPVPTTDASLDGAEVSPDIVELRGGHALVAEDDTVSQLVASRLLGKLGWTFDVVSDGHQAVEAVAARPYDAILMDCEMPVMDGLTATRLIRAGSAKRVPILAVTANVLPDQQRACREAGADEHLAKPVTLARLREALACARGTDRRQPAVE